jgi:type IV pilus assembly protein PilW
MLRTFQSVRIRTSQRGFSLIELMIAMLIALFLLGGLVTLVMGTRRSGATQTALSQLQDNQRIAMTMITNIIQKAGYFPDPVHQQLSTFSAETIGTLALASGQVLGGTYSVTAPGDTFATRFFAPANDTANGTAIIDCSGQSNASASSGVWYTNLFAVGLVNGTSWLQCQSQTSGAAASLLVINLIPNVTNITVMYGVGSGSAGDDYGVVQYLNASQVTAANSWSNVTVVKVTLTFQLPAYGTTGGQMTNCVTTPACTSTFTRVIPIMSRAGVDT